MGVNPQHAEALLALPVLELRDRLASGALSALDLTQACIARIAAREPEIGAWAWFDSDYACEQARALDARRATGLPTGPLHGLPVGLKDIIDTAKVPTENGCEADQGRVPKKDAFVVERLKAAGAVIMGKTVTTELAFMRPSKTRNPHDTSHTAGGSSSGSAAAVAAGMIPLAVGTQTGGSVIRPAAFCGVTGFKPTFGAIPRRGILMQSPSLDTVGVFAADPAGAALLAEVLYGHDPSDPATAPRPFPRLSKTALSKPPVLPDFAFVRPPGWDAADQDTRDALAELVAALGDKVIEVALPAPFEAAARERRRINFAEMARHYFRYGRDAQDMLGPEIRGALEDGNAILARDYLAALDWKPVLNAALCEIFERCDAILCPAAPGPAPRDVGTTGDPVFNSLWTFCGTPAVTLPLLTATNGMPMGVQLVGSHGNDARLLRTARWLYDWANH
ncbi:amidase [Aestuariibius sp. 2305UL40-4]|uniref:amidase n=1 Tax=Aestuariibius violaceus TaxID=3234132 RepID=UPI00345E9539